MLLEWYNDVIENLGDTYTAVEIIGTLLHPDSLLNNLLLRPDFESRTYRSIEKFADRDDLWTEWRTRYTNLSDPHRIENARAFYEANEHAMLQGAKVLWDAKEDYYTLMTQLTNMGRAAFFKEKQNQPTPRRGILLRPDPNNKIPRQRRPNHIPPPPRRKLPHCLPIIFCRSRSVPSVPSVLSV